MPQVLRPADEITRPTAYLFWLILLLCAGIAAGAEHPNIVLIMTDDMGFSDVGCYGGEIETPNIDRLAAGGVKFSQFYNCGKCEPTRAALVTGHQWWTYNPDVAIRRDSPNVGEVMRTAGYRTMMVGKWHAEGVPFQRGFDRHFGFMGGGTNYFLGDDSFTLDGRPWQVPKDNFYVTTALTDYAVRFIREEQQSHRDKPFFLYLAYNAPHSPIQAPAELVTKYRGKYLKGWDEIRRERFERQQKLGLAGLGWSLPERPENLPAWDTLDDKNKDFEDLRMATYAAMVDCVDQGVGAVMRTLDELGIRDNTLVIFLNDNLADERPEKLAELLAIQQAFHARPDVRLRLSSGEREPEYAPPYLPDGIRGPGARESVPDEVYALLLAKARAEGRQLSETERDALRAQAAAKKRAFEGSAPKKRRKKAKS